MPHVSPNIIPHDLGQKNYFPFKNCQIYQNFTQWKITYPLWCLLCGGRDPASKPASYSPTVTNLTYPSKPMPPALPVTPNLLWCLLCAGWDPASKPASYSPTVTNLTYPWVYHVTCSSKNSKSSHLHPVMPSMLRKRSCFKTYLILSSVLHYNSYQPHLSHLNPCHLLFQQLQISSPAASEMSSMWRKLEIICPLE